MMGPKWTGRTDELTETARKLYFDQGVFSTVIAARFGCSRNSVISRMSRKFGKLGGAECYQRQHHGRKIADGDLQGAIRAKKRRKAVRAPTVELPAICVGGTTILTLTARTCRWPIGDPQRVDFRFCGALTTIEEPYCPACRKLAYQERKPPRLMQLARIM